MFFLARPDEDIHKRDGGTGTFQEARRLAVQPGESLLGVDHVNCVDQGLQALMFPSGILRRFGSRE
jgi:hypothetical protein